MRLGLLEGSPGAPGIVPLIYRPFALGYIWRLFRRLLYLLSLYLAIQSQEGTITGTIR